MKWSWRNFGMSATVKAGVCKLGRPSGSVSLEVCNSNSRQLLFQIGHLDATKRENFTTKRYLLKEYHLS
jgi:hypothetical protein